MNPRRVRVRFAPSPTGPLHIGGVRTALYNYLFARRHGGDMILRIEDTDSQRFVPGAEAYIIEALQWLGIEIDEGVGKGGPHAPYRQSERRDIYRAHVKQLLDAGRAYIAFDTPEELAAKRAEVANFQYDATTRMSMRNSLALPAEEVERLMAEGAPYVVRFLVEPGRDITVNDLLRGQVTVNSSVLDDKVLYKSADDLPTYHLANIVDDKLMEVSHVIRGEEWLPSAPLHVLLYEAFGWADIMPEFVHLPLLLKPDGKGKLSKRDGDKLGFPVFPLEWHDPASGAISAGYREQGYLPEAVVNFLALLGWNPGDDTEVMSMQQLIDKFSFDHCSRAGAKFAYEKGRWFNHEYLAAMPAAEAARLLRPEMQRRGINPDDFTPEYIEQAVALVKERAQLLPEVLDHAAFLFTAPEEYEPKAVKKRWSADTPANLRALLSRLRERHADAPGSPEAEADILDWIRAEGLHMGNTMNALRLAVVGECKGPDMFAIIGLLGLDETERRTERAIAALPAAANTSPL